MDHNLPVVTKKTWNIVRAVLFMLKKGISKGKIIFKLELNMMMKRGKIAGKTMMGNFLFHHNHHSDSSRKSNQLACAQLPPTPTPDIETLTTVNMVLEKLNYKESPRILGSRRDPLVRQVRVTDSPFPFQDAKDNNDYQVDAAAEEFIKKFYKQLKNQISSPAQGH